MSFNPDRSPIQDITQSNPGIVMTSIPHGLITGQIVRIHVPKSYGMVELNNDSVSVTVISPTIFSMQYTQVPVAVNVNTTFYTPFTIPAVSRFTAEVLPIGAGPTPVLEPFFNARNGLCVSSPNDPFTNTSITEIPF
jgi:hypothetical protein